MRRIAIAVLLSALCAMAEGVSGKWSGIFTPDSGEGDQSLFLILTQDGSKLTGSGGPNESEQHPMQNGKVEGDHVTFEVPAGGGKFTFDLRMNGDELKGDLRVEGKENVRTAKVAVTRAAG